MRAFSRDFIEFFLLSNWPVLRSVSVRGDVFALFLLLKSFFSVTVKYVLLFSERFLNFLLRYENWAKNYRIIVKAKMFLFMDIDFYVISR